MLIAEFKDKSKRVEYFTQALRAQGLTSSVKVMCIIFCNTIVVDKLHGHMLF